MNLFGSPTGTYATRRKRFFSELGSADPTTGLTTVFCWGLDVRYIYIYIIVYIYYIIYIHALYITPAYRQYITVGYVTL